MSWDNNPYYHPEKMGLSTVAEFDSADSYEFDKFVVWTDGKALFWATDSGCSCPTPFEDINNLGDLCSGRPKECLAANRHVDRRGLPPRSERHGGTQGLGAGMEAQRAMTAVLNRVIALYTLGAALAFDDFAWAERAAKDYADASIETLRSAR